MERWILATFCGECGEPIPLDVVSLLEYNPGVDGHLFKSEAAALDAWEATQKAIHRYGYFLSDDGGFLTPRGMDSEVEETQPAQRGRRIYHLDAYQDVRAVRITIHIEKP